MEPKPLLPRPPVAASEPFDPLRRPSRSEVPARRTGRPGEDEPWRRPTALAFAAAGLLGAGWMLVHGVEQMFSCLIWCSEQDEATSGAGQGLALLSGFVAIIVTFCTHELAGTGPRWSRMFGAWAALVGAAVTYVLLDTTPAVPRTASGMAFVPLAVFLATILPPRDVRATWCCLGGGLVIATLLSDLGVLPAVGLALLPYLLLEATVARRSAA